MKKLNFIFIILFAVCLTACDINQQYVNVPVDYAPKLVFNPDTTTIVIINRFAFDSTRMNPRKLAVLKAGAYSSVAGLTEQLKMLPGVNAINLVDSASFAKNADSVKSLLARYKADYVLTFDKFNAARTMQNVYNGFYYGFSSYYNTMVNVSFTLYEKNGLYKKLDGKVSDMQTEEELLSTDRSAIGGNVISVNYSARNAALNALQDYLPSTMWHNRPLYSNNNYLMVSVAQIQAGRYDRAYKTLNPLIDGADLKLASRAAYNLAVVYEAQGDIEEALKVAKESNSKQQNDYATTLIAELMRE